MSIVDFPFKWLGGGGGTAPVRLLRSLRSFGLLLLSFGGSPANAMDYMLEYGVYAGSASDEGVVACRTRCRAEIKSLGVMLHASVSASGSSVQINNIRERRDKRDCCLFDGKELVFADNERVASIDVRGAINKLPIFFYVRGTGRLEKIGVLYLRINNFELPPIFR